MGLFFDFIIALIFFLTYKFYGLTPAIYAAAIASLLQNIVYFFYKKRFSFLYLFIFLMIVIFGGATIIFHNETYIKLKPTVINWLLAMLFLITEFKIFNLKPFIQKFFGEKIELSDQDWRRLNRLWILFFFIIGAINLYIAHYFSTNAWVNFKLFGIVGLSLLFAILQSLYITYKLNLK